jgi:hypothetical protein
MTPTPKYIGLPEVASREFMVAEKPPISVPEQYSGMLQHAEDWLGKEHPGYKLYISGELHKKLVKHYLSGESKRLVPHTVFPKRSFLNESEVLRRTREDGLFEAGDDIV